MSGAGAPVEDPVAVVDELVAGVAGFCPLQALLDDPEVEEISTKPRGRARQRASQWKHL